MGVIADRLKLLIQQMEESDRRLESISSEYIATATKQLKEMEEMIKED